VPDDPTKVVSTKLTAQEHDALFEECNKRGCTFKEFLREACLRAMDIKPESSMHAPHQKENFENQNLPGLKEKIAKLESDLNKANSLVSAQNQKIKEFYRFVPESELNKRKFGEIIHES